MGFLHHLSTLALQSAAEGACSVLGVSSGEHAAEHVVGFLSRHFQDHSLSLNRAMQEAAGKAWKALEIALAGESLWSWLDTADHKAFRQQVRAFLEVTPLDTLSSHGPNFRRRCLKELRLARNQGLLSGTLEPQALAQEVGTFARFSDPHSLLQAECQALERMAEDCRQAGYPDVAHLVCLNNTETGGRALLVTAVRFFFRRQIESDQELFQGLAWARFEVLQQTQEQAFAGLAEVIAQHGDRLEALLLSVQEVVVETRDVVRDIQQEVAELGRRFDLLHREWRPRDSLSINSAAERQLVKQLVARYRALPEEQRQQFPALLNAIGKLEIATGAFDAAQQDFVKAADLARDRAEQAEAHFNLFGAALERTDWSAALAALQKAAELEPQKYAPFPLRKYEPEKILGAGGFGVAFLCRNRLSGSQVVVKTLRSDTLARDVNEVFREAQMLEQLDHPAIIRLRDCDYADSEMTRPYLVMDFFDGETLDRRVATSGRLSAPELVALIRPVAEALQAAHARGILHRDVKPGNLLVRKDDAAWRVKLIDFGLALKQDMLHSTAATGRTMTSSSIAGTLDYAAPEQLGRWPGVAPGPYTDIYGFAKTCCYALFQTVQPLRKHWREVPEELADLLEQCLNENPEERLPNFDRVLASMARLTGAASPPEPAPGPLTAHSTGRSREWWRVTPEGAPVPGGALTQLRRLTGHTDAVLSVAFAPDGRHVLSGSADHTARLWNLETCEAVQVLHGHTEKVCQVRFLPGQRLAVSASKDRSVRFWDLDNGRECRTLPSRTNRSLAISPDGQYALSGNVADGMIRVWEVPTGRELRRLKGHMSWVFGLDFSPDGRRALSSSADGTVRLWDIHSGRELRRLQGHKDKVSSVVFTPDGHRALSTGADRTVLFWDLRTGKVQRCWDEFRDQIWSVVVSPDGYLALCDGDDGEVRLWELDTGTALARSTGHDGKVLSVAFSPDARLAVTAGSDKAIVVWSL
jgi:WD40 repeat protein/tRNA A-37 threonylcarbamoyl transferase component Bud32